ncbi:hypothetical protein J6590_099096 [Homalodisca vitripennis]|nr:hypothetical protein J6590_099096 [Homalodisca vitripennis]
MKHMTSKRGKSILAKSKETNNALELLSTTRKILAFNQKINEMFSMMTVNVIFDGLLAFVHCLSAYWRVYGLDEKVDCLEYHAPALALFLQGYIISELLCFGKTTSSTSTFKFARRVSKAVRNDPRSQSATHALSYGLGSSLCRLHRVMLPRLGSPWLLVDEYASY